MDPLPPDFFQRPVLTVAPELLGCLLCRQQPDGSSKKWRITEVEAYDGEEDLACHAARGRTRRTEVMYAAGGIWYVYLCYGIHHLLNIVTGYQDYPAAVLIRGTHEVEGPGRLTRALQIDKTHNAKPATPSTGLWIEKGKTKIPPREIHRTPRIGVDYAGEWAAKPYRFVYTDKH